MEKNGLPPDREKGASEGDQEEPLHDRNEVMKQAEEKAVEFFAPASPKRRSHHDDRGKNA